MGILTVWSVRNIACFVDTR